MMLPGVSLDAADVTLAITVDTAPPLLNCEMVDAAPDPDVVAVAVALTPLTLPTAVHRPSTPAKSE